MPSLKKIKEYYYVDKLAHPHKQTDTQTDGQADGQMDEQTERWTDRLMQTITIPLRPWCRGVEIDETNLLKTV